MTEGDRERLIDLTDAFCDHVVAQREETAVILSEIERLNTLTKTLALALHNVNLAVAEIERILTKGEQ